MKLKSIFIISFVLGVAPCAIHAAPVNVNSADSAQIASALPGIGLVKAQRIAEYCQKNPCQKSEDLLAVKGVGPKTLERIQQDLRFSDQ
ncbi:competence protein ComE [Thiosulfatimonas sediminis]|uniref:Competence protein ComE n=1 Tax=Thiosulfatimonas sediminis TaxID=2675054 RepID=A0A6F8PSW1_9GAMM|nr:helix-hairpin-helix domain-containing protein [Thiosulfatimonas sediminis]BBP45205.1 competence protein ComE [Thiosulfatimonas sediminis]